MAIYVSRYPCQALFKDRREIRRGILKILQAPIKGIYDSIDIILFILFIGGFMFVFNETGAMMKGITWLSYSMKGRSHY
jgi:uncharacterized ion transporter superfamily protein YfcC